VEIPERMKLQQTSGSYEEWIPKLSGRLRRLKKEEGKPEGKLEGKAHLV
jgi:hypothetical protein